MNIDQSAVKSLVSAASKGDLKLVEKFLQKVPVDSVDEQSQTALHYACANGQNSVVRYLIKKGAPLDYGNWCGWMPIMLAACYGHADVVRLLVQNNAKVNIENNRGVNPLTCAACFGHESVVEVLLDILHGDINLKATTKVFVTPLMAAAQHGYVKIVNLLLQYNINATDYCHPDTGYSALMISAANGHLEIVRMLIEKGGADANLANVAGQTAYGLSIAKKKDDVRAYLKDRTQRRVWCPSSEPTLIDAAKLGNIDLLRKLLSENNADVNMTDENGATPLFFACILDMIEMVQVLLDAGASTDVQDNTYGWTPLMHTTLKQQIDIIRLLLKYGANMNIKNYEDLSAFDIATRVGMPEITRLLAPNASRGQATVQDNEKKSRGSSQNWFSKFGIKQHATQAFSRVPVPQVNEILEEDTEELKKTSSVISIFDANKAMSGSAKPRISLLYPQVILPDDVVAPILQPFSKLPGFDLPRMPIVNTRLSSSNGSNTEWSPKNSSDDSTSLKAQLSCMEKKKGRNVQRPQQEANNIHISVPGTEPDSPQSSMTSSGFTSISQFQGPAVMPREFKDLSPTLDSRIPFQKPAASAWLPPPIHDVDGFHNMNSKMHQAIYNSKKKSADLLPDINDMSIKSIDLSMKSPHVNTKMNHSDDIQSLLRQLSLENYHSNFEEEEVDLETLKEMDDDDLKLMGIDKTVYRDRILDAVGKKKKNCRSQCDVGMNAIHQPSRSGTTLSAPGDCTGDMGGGKGSRGHKSYSLHDIPGVYKPLFPSTPPGGLADLKLAPLPVYPTVPKEKLGVM